MLNIFFPAQADVIVKEKLREGLLERDAGNPFSTLTLPEAIDMDVTCLASIEYVQ